LGKMREATRLSGKKNKDKPEGIKPEKATEEANQTTEASKNGGWGFSQGKKEDAPSSIGRSY